MSEVIFFLITTFFVISGMTFWFKPVSKYPSCVKEMYQCEMKTDLQILQMKVSQQEANDDK